MFHLPVIVQTKEGRQVGSILNWGGGHYASRELFDQGREAVSWSKKVTELFFCKIPRFLRPWKETNRRCHRVTMLKLPQSSLLWFILIHSVVYLHDTSTNERRIVLQLTIQCLDTYITRHASKPEQHCITTKRLDIIIAYQLIHVTEGRSSLQSPRCHSQVACSRFTPFSPGVAPP